MADRTVNININYSINTAAINQATAASVKAQQATDNLKNSTNQAAAAQQNLGNQAQKTGSQFSGSIEGVKVRMQQLRAQIELTNRSDTSRMNTLISQYRAARKEVDDFNKKLSEGKPQVQSLTTQFGQLFTAVKLFLTAGLAKELIDINLNMAKLAGNVQGVEKAFRRTFANSDLMLLKLKESTHGTVSEFDLMQKALKASNLGVPIQNLGTLLEFAATRAQQTGDSVDYLVNSIIDGLGRKSILKLDNLGVSASRLKDAMGGISTQTATVAQVTEAFTKVANEELQKMGGYAETAATDVDKLSASIQALKIEVSKQFDNSRVIKFFDELVVGITNYIKGNKEFLVEQAREIAARDAGRVVESKAFKELGNNQQAKIDFIQQEANSRVQLIGRYNDMIEKLKEEREETIKNKGPYDKRIESINKNINALEANKVVLTSTILALKGYITELEKANDEEEESVGLIEALKTKIEGLNDSITKAKTPEEIERLNKELVNTEFQLRELVELGKAFINPLASKIFDIRQGVGDKAPPPPSAPTSKDTEKIIIDIAKKQGEVFNKALGESVDVSTELERAWFNAADALKQAGIDIFADQLISIEMAEVASLQNRLNNLRNFYDEQQLLAGNNERAKSDLRIREERETAALQKRIAEKERSARRFQIIIDTAAAIARLWVKPGFPEAIPLTALVAAQGASQLAIVNRTPARFAKGVLNLQGPGTETSDSIPSMLSKGESVMTAKETRRSLGLLEAIKDNRIDDRILSKLHLGGGGVHVVPWDNRPVVDAIQKNKAPNLIREGRQIYEVIEDKQKNKKFIRSKSI